MDNKLSELSKPVGYFTKQRDGNYWPLSKSTAKMNMEPLYSQEYVSALLAERDAFEASALAMLDEWRARGERIAELEAIRVDASQVFKEIGNELGCNPDNESIMVAIDALKEREKRVVALAGGNAELWETMATRLEEAEKRLATPVRLTEERTLWAGEDDYDTGHVKGWNANRIEQAALLKKQGFTVEGDS
ncbi:hypothetical protein I5P78_11045 [Serratia marcescens]|nr:hypothetical protein [Serratia marcescens]